MIDIDHGSGMGQGWIMSLGIKDQLQELEKDGKGSKSKQPGAHGFSGADVRHIEIQGQLGSHAIIPNGIVILQQLLIKFNDTIIRQ
jgi:hypothetical protein